MLKTFTEFCTENIDLVKNEEIREFIKNFYWANPSVFQRLLSFSRLAEVKAPTVTLEHTISMLGELITTTEMATEDAAKIFSLLRKHFPDVECIKEKFVDA